MQYPKNINVKIACKFQGKYSAVPVGFEDHWCHLIFNIKMKFTRKDRFIAGDHFTDPSKTMPYASVVS